MHFYDLFDHIVRFEKASLRMYGLLGLVWCFLVKLLISLNILRFKESLTMNEEYHRRRFSHMGQHILDKN